MAASREDISSWFDRAVAEGSTHMIVVCDTFDYEDYPVQVGGNLGLQDDRTVREIVNDFNTKSMQQVMEVYDLRLSKQMQMAEHRSFHMDDEIEAKQTSAFEEPS